MSKNRFQLGSRATAFPIDPLAGIKGTYAGRERGGDKGKGNGEGRRKGEKGLGREVMEGSGGDPRVYL